MRRIAEGGTDEEIALEFLTLPEVIAVYRMVWEKTDCVDDARREETSDVEKQPKMDTMYLCVAHMLGRGVSAQDIAALIRRPLSYVMSIKDREIRRTRHNKTRRKKP